MKTKFYTLLSVMLLSMMMGLKAQTVNADKLVIDGPPYDWNIESINTNTLNFKYYNTNALSLSSGGNVGIGTLTPKSKLEVNGWIGRTAHNNGALVGSYNNVGANSTYSNPIYVIGSNYKPSTTTLSNMYGIGYSHTNASFISNPTVGGWGMYVAADGDARIFLNASNNGDSYFNSGNVGVGTSTPSKKLHVNGDTYLQGKVYIGSTDTYFYRDAANRIKTDDMFYVGTSSPATYLYSTNTYLGASSGDKIHLRGNIFEWTSGTGGIINSSGQMGIGTKAPRSGSKVHINGGYGISMERDEGAPWGDTKANIGISTNTGVVGLRFTITDDDNWSNMVDVLHLGNNAKVGIGTTNPTAKLTVDGDILCEKVRVISNVPASDYVFESEYELINIEELERYVIEHQHLPNIPSAEEFKENGYDVGTMDDLLLRKVEEQTLYIIELNNRLRALEELINSNN